MASLRELVVVRSSLALPATLPSLGTGARYGPRLRAPTPSWEHCHDSHMPVKGKPSQLSASITVVRVGEHPSTANGSGSGHGSPAGWG